MNLLDEWRSLADFFEIKGAFEVHVSLGVVNMISVTVYNFLLGKLLNQNVFITHFQTQAVAVKG